MVRWFLTTAIVGPIPMLINLCLVPVITDFQLLLDNGKYLSMLYLAIQASSEKEQVSFKWHWHKFRIGSLNMVKIGAYVV
jgi:hypothetical protein